MSNFSRLFGATLFCATVGVTVLPAATITSYSLTFDGNSIGGGAGNVSLTPPQLPGYQVDGTLDIYDLTTGLPPVFPGPVGGFALRFTNALISCKGISGSGCGTTILDFSALVNFTPNAPPVQLTGIFGLEGSSTANSFLSAFAAGNFSTLVIGNVSSLGNFNYSVAVPAFFVSNTATSLTISMTLLINSLADGQSISLPNSLFLQLGQSSVPEPGTMAIVAAGLAGAFWFRRRMN